MIIQQRNQNDGKQKGMALIMVILVGAIALIAVTTSTALVISEFKKNIAATSGISQYQLTYGALENSFMRLLRDPNYSGETLQLSNSTCYITVSGSPSNKSVESVCGNGSYVRKMGATVTFSGGRMTVSSIAELP